MTCAILVPPRGGIGLGRRRYLACRWLPLGLNRVRLRIDGDWMVRALFPHLSEAVASTAIAFAPAAVSL